MPNRLFRPITIRAKRYWQLYFSDGQLKPDLGIRNLLPEWKKIFSTKNLKDDFFAGVTVACVAIPLSLAIALASKVDPAVGIVTAIVAGIVCAFFGGTPLAVSGPAAAMAVLIASVVEQFGVGGLLVVGMGCGLMQLLSGVFGLGKLIRYVPMPVITGFTAGIGAIILIGQLPRGLGLPPPTQGHVIDVLKHVSEMIHQTNYTAALLALCTILIAKLLPKFAPKLPSPLVAVTVPSILVAIFGLDTPLIGQIPSSLPMPKFPVFPTENLQELIGTAFIVFSLASLETLLSSSAVDKLARTRHDPDQELIGQGLGNLIVPLFGGIPVTGVIARSALNVKSGAKSRRSSIIHSFALLATVFVLAPIMSKIPIAALAGMLISVALGMLNPHEFLQIVRTSRSEALVYTVTFLTILAVDLIVGVQAGIVAALVIAVLQLGRTRLFTHNYGATEPSRLALSGPLTFLSSSRFAQLERYASENDLGGLAILDLSGVTSLDSSGASMLVDFVQSMRGTGTKIVLKGLPIRCRRTLENFDMENVTRDSHASSESDIIKFLDGRVSQPRQRLTSGVEIFRREHRYRYEQIFKQLATTQEPHTLFLTCSDSRIVPNLITSTDPGELFIVRNVGNSICPYGYDDAPAAGAAAEFAVAVLKVKEIIICGHTQCGAMKALMTQPDLRGVPSLQQWLKMIGKTRELHPEVEDADVLARWHVIQQIENLMSYPIIKTQVEEGTLKVRGWLYDVPNTEILEWHGSQNEFSVLGLREADLA